MRPCTEYDIAVRGGWRNDDTASADLICRNHDDRRELLSESWLTLDEIKVAVAAHLVEGAP